MPTVLILAATDDALISTTIDLFSTSMAGTTIETGQPIGIWPTVEAYPTGDDPAALAMPFLLFFLFAITLILETFSCVVDRNLCNLNLVTSFFAYNHIISHI